MGAGKAISFTRASAELEETVGKATGRRLSDGATNPIVSSLSFSLANALSNPLVIAIDGLTRTTNIQICPGPGS